MKPIIRIAVHPRSRTLVGWALRATGPVLLIVLLLRVVDYGELRATVDDIRLPWALAGLATFQLFILLRTLRWIEIHEGFGLSRASMGYQLRLSYATGFAAAVLPQVLTPFSRLALLLQDGYRVQRAAAGSALEKALELAAFVCFGVYGSIFLGSAFGHLVWWSLGLALATGGVGVGLYLGRRRLGRLAVVLVAKIPGVSEAVGADLAELAQDVAALRGRVLLRLVGWSVVIALTQATVLYFLSRSLGIGLSYAFMTAVWGIIALSMLLPLTVNGIGTREAILAVAFRAAGESTDAAVALGLLTMAVIVAGSAPGALEWLRRFLTKSSGAVSVEARRTTSSAMPSATAHPQGERDR